MEHRWHMVHDPEQPPQPPAAPLPLDYRKPRDERRGIHAGWIFAAGLLLAFGGTAVAGAMWFLNLYGLESRGKRYWAPVWIWVGMTVISLLFAGKMLARRPLSRGRWFLLGMLTGLGLWSLLEGICFAKP